MTNPKMSTNKDNQPKCKYCYDKKYFSVAEGGNICLGDFEGDPNFEVPLEIKQYPCRKCNKDNQPAQGINPGIQKTVDWLNSLGFKNLG